MKGTATRRPDGATFTRMVLVLLVIVVISAAPSRAQSPLFEDAFNLCHILDPSHPVPEGFGAAYDVVEPTRVAVAPFLANLLCASCTDTGATVTAGLSPTLAVGFGLQAIYRYGYEWRDGQWHQFTFTGANVIDFSGDGITTSAAATLTRTPEAMREGNWFVGYVCSWDIWERRWKCGCRDQACTTSYWQLQGFQLR